MTMINLFKLLAISPSARLYYTLILILCFSDLANAQYQFPAQESYKLKNKMRVVFIDYGSLPVTRLTLYVNTGKKNETPGMQSISDLTVQSLLLGNEKYTRVQQDSLLHLMGASLNASGNENFTTVNMQFLNKDEETAAGIFASVILKPLFPKDEIAEMVKETITYNTPAKMNARQLAFVFSKYFVFGAGNPLGRNFYSAQLNKITADQVREFYKFNFTPKNCTLVVCGHPDKEKLKPLIEKYFGGWEAAYGETNGVSLSDPDFSKKEYAFVNRDNATQAALVWTKKAPYINSRDLPEFEVANEAFSLLLFKEIREKEGKTYGIESGFNNEDNDGTFMVATQVRNEVMAGTVASFDRVLKQFYDSGAPEELFQTAKAQYKSSLTALQTPGQVTAVFNPFLYPDYEKREKYLTGIDAIDLAKVNRVIKKYFTPGSYKLVIAGSGKDLAPQLSTLPGLVKLPLNAIEADEVK